MHPQRTTKNQHIHLQAKVCFLRNALALIVIAFTFAESTSASSFNFRIQDYKPDKFRDLQWTLEWNLNGNDSREYGVVIHDSGWVQDSRLRQYDNDYRQNSIALNSGVSIRKFSLLSVYDMASQIRVSYDRQTRDSHDSCATCSDYSYNRFDLSHAFSIYEDRDARMELRHVSDYRHYLHPDFSIGLSVSIQAYFSSSRSKSSIHGYREIPDTGGYTNHDSWSDNSQDKYTSRRVYESYKFGPAFGRQHEGKYAAAALFVLDELKKRGLLDSVPSREAIIALADTMYFYQNEMDWNERDLRIRTTMAIGNSMEAFGVWKEPSSHSILVLDDIWQYYTRSRRLFGTLAQIRVIANKQHERLKSQVTGQETLYREIFHLDTIGAVSSQSTANSYKTKGEYESSSNDYRLAVSVSHCEPFALRWQWNADAEFSTPMSASISDSYRSHRRDSSIARTFRLVDNYLATLSSSLEFIADKKTSIRLTGIGTIERRMTNNLSFINSPHSTQNRKNRSLTGGLSLLYYLNNRSIFQFNVTGRYNHFWTRTKVSETRGNDSNLGFNISMTHYIK